MKRILLISAIFLFIACENCEDEKDRIWNNHLEEMEAMGDNPNMEQVEALQRQRDRDLANACD